jgi:hypothetical protein
MQFIFSALYAILSDSIFILFEFMVSHIKSCFEYASLVIDKQVEHYWDTNNIQS